MRGRAFSWLGAALGYAALPPCAAALAAARLPALLPSMPEIAWTAAPLLLGGLTALLALAMRRVGVGAAALLLAAPCLSAQGALYEALRPALFVLLPLNGAAALVASRGAVVALAAWGLAFAAQGGLLRAVPPSPDVGAAAVTGAHGAAAALLLGALAVRARTRETPALLAGLGMLGALAVAWRNGGVPSAAQAVALVAAVAPLPCALLRGLHALAYRDGLTGLPGRRALDERLDAWRGVGAVAMVDVDHFKQFNDRHGHEAGDEVLRMVAAQLRRTKGAQVHRYGGEEFAMLFPRLDVQQAQERAEEARDAVRTTPFTLRVPSRGRRSSKRRAHDPKRQRAGARPKQRRLRVTISVGVAPVVPQPHAATQALREADRALYRAKRAGRDCVRRAKSSKSRARTGT